VTRYIRFQNGHSSTYGIEENGTVRELQGDLFHHTQTGKTHALKEVKLLYLRRAELSQPHWRKACAGASGDFLQAAFLSAESW
jgi:hypothetical protein